MQTTSPSRATVLRGALSHNVLRSLVAMVLVVLANVMVPHGTARGKAVDGTQDQGVGTAYWPATTLLDDRVCASVPRVAGPTSTVADRMRDGTVLHVRTWDARGVVVCPDQDKFGGPRLELLPPMAALPWTRGARARLAREDPSGDLVDKGQPELLEAYTGAFDPKSELPVVEVDLPTGLRKDSTRTIAASFVPLTVGTLALLLLLTLPLVVSLSRRVQRAQTELAKVRHELLASELERRRIADDLHHGVIQELAGLAYVLPTVARHLDAGGNLNVARSLLERTTSLVERNVVSLRSLMTIIYPPNLDAEGLRDAVQLLVHTEALNAGIEAHIYMAHDIDLPPETAHLAYRVIREGVRNVVKHAGSSEVIVDLATTGSEVLVRVLDDGRGPGDRPGYSPKGHLGLRLLADAVRDFGGRTDVRPRATGGTELTARFPVKPGPAVTSTRSR